MRFNKRVFPKEWQDEYSLGLLLCGDLVVSYMAAPRILSIIFQASYTILLLFVPRTYASTFWACERQSPLPTISPCLPSDVSRYQHQTTKESWAVHHPQELH